MSFWTELNRRNVVKVGMAYVIVGWIMLEVASVLAPALNLPAWATTFVVFLLILGFPIALVLAWAYELTPDGVKRAADVPMGESIAPATGQKFNYAVIGLLIVAVGLLTVQLFFGNSEPTNDESLRNSVAVLPFHNLSPDPDNAFFAAGIHESTLNQLAKISDLSVIARTSVLQYENDPPPIPEIAEALNVEMVMEGSVRYANDRVLVTAQLIDGRSGTHIWAEEFDRGLADIFAVQGEIAQRIAAALEAELTQDERESIERPSTSSPDALASYLRAMSLWDYDETAIGSPDVRSAIESALDAAIELGPDLAEAYAQRALLYLLTLNVQGGDSSDFESRRRELEQRALADVATATRLNHGLGAALGVLGRVHQYNWRPVAAREAYLRAVELSPNNSRILRDFAWFRAMLGEHEAAIALAQRAVELDPVNGMSRYVLALLHLYAGDVPAAQRLYREGIAVAPDYPNLYIDLAHVEAILGNRESGIELLQIAERLFAGNTNAVFTAEIADGYGRLGDQDSAARLFRRLEATAAERPIPHTAWILGYLAIDDPARALEEMSVAALDPPLYAGHFGLATLAANGWKNPVLEQPEFVEARSRIAFGSQAGGD